MKMLILEVTKIVILRQSHTMDHICITSDGPSLFPELEEQHPGQYPESFEVRAKHGYAEEWLALRGFTEDDYELIEH